MAHCFTTFFEVVFLTVKIHLIFTREFAYNFAYNKQFALRLFHCNKLYGKYKKERKKSLVWENDTL